MIEQIQQQLETTKITRGQLDLNGRCNASCWFCPVKFQGNPEQFKQHMPVETLERVLENIRGSKFVDQHVFTYTSHYNEILLYRHFEAMIPLFRAHNMSTMILSNGTPFTPAKIDLVLGNPDVFHGITLNIPAFELEDWKTKTGMTDAAYKALFRNLDYLHSKGHADIQINCAPNDVLMVNGVPNTHNDVLVIQQRFQERYPNFTVRLNTWLSDRAGRLAEHQVISHVRPSVKPVIGCSHSGSAGGRPFEWFHINALGDMFICCDDFEMEYRFGNLAEQSFDDIWLSYAHAQAIVRAREGLCKTCNFRVEAS